MRYYLNSGLFAAIILFFFLPFIEIKCNESTLATMSGYDLATAGDIALDDPTMAEYMKDNEEFKSMSEKSKHPEPLTIGSLIFALSGLIINLAVRKKREVLTVVLTSLIAIVLLLFRYIFLTKWEENMSAADELGGFIKIGAEFSTGFWLAVIGAVVALGLNIYYLVNDKKDSYISVYDPTKESPDTQEEV
jgi:uncharacterized membrane protein (DUF485 family)